MIKMIVFNRDKLLIFWLIASSFGIMFAVLSWAQEAGIIPGTEELGIWKGVMAVISGFVLYFIVAKNIPGGPGDIK